MGDHWNVLLLNQLLAPELRSNGSSARIWHSPTVQDAATAPEQLRDGHPRRIATAQTALPEPQRPLRIAVCYWGLSRGVARQVIASQQSWLYEPLRQQRHSLTVAMHTWRLHENVSYVWNQAFENPKEEDAFDVFRPDHAAIDDQREFVAGFHPERYYASAEQQRRICPPWFALHGEPCKLCDASAAPPTTTALPCKLYTNRTVLNAMCAMESQRRAYRMIKRLEQPMCQERHVRY